MQDKNIKEIIFEFKEKSKNIFKKYGRIILIFLILISFFICLYIYKTIFTNKDLEITFFDIGQGDSILIKTPSKKNVLIDAGPDEKVVRKLENKLSIFDHTIDLAILSHPDSDHTAGYIYLFDKYNVKNILQNGDKSKDSEIYKEMKNKINSEIENIKSKEYNANCGDKIYLDKINIKENKNVDLKDETILYILHPFKKNLVLNDSNENSIVLLLTNSNYSFLFTGDMDKENEKKLFFDIDICFEKSEAQNIKDKLKDLTVLKVSHHGSNTASSETFLKQLKPKYSIISAGKNNRYGHPSPETMTLLEKYSDNIIKTTESGDITFTINNNLLKIEKQK